MRWSAVTSSAAGSRPTAPRPPAPHGDVGRRAAAAAEGRRADLRRALPPGPRGPGPGPRRPDPRRGAAARHTRPIWAASPLARTGEGHHDDATPAPSPAAPGSIVDGYCDVCGSPPSPPAARTGRHPERRLDRRPTAPGGSGARLRRDVTRPGSATRPSTVSRASNRARRSTAARVRPGGRQRRPASPAGSAPRSTRLRGARLGAGLTTVPPIPAIDAAKAIMKNPAGPGGQAGLPELRRRGRPLPRRPARAHRGLLRASAATRSPSPRSCRPATWSAASTRWPAASPTAASAGSTSPATTTSPTAGSCSRACSTPATPTPSPPRSPSSSSWPRSSTR